MLHQHRRGRPQDYEPQLLLNEYRRRILNYLIILTTTAALLTELPMLPFNYIVAYENTN